MLLSSFTAATLQDTPRPTLIRVRGLIALRSDQQVAIEGAMGAIGIAKVTDIARTIGVTALPGPVTDAPGDYWQTWMGLISPPVVGAIASGTPGPSITYLQVDSKGQRKIGDLDALVVMVETGSATGFEIAIALRFLFLLS